MTSEELPAAPDIQQGTNEVMHDDRIYQFENGVSHMRYILAQLLGERTTEGEAETAMTASSARESGGTAVERVAVSRGSRGGDAEATRNEQTGERQARRSPSPARIF